MTRTVSPSPSRSRDTTDDHCSSPEYKPQILVSKSRKTPSPRKKKTSHSPSSTTKSSSSSCSGAVGSWTPEKKMGVMERVVAEGVKAVNIAELAAEFGVSAVQMKNALQAGRVGNLRDKAIKSVAGLEHK